MYFAAEKGYKNVVNALIDKGADVHAEDKNGKTPLHLAIFKNKENVVELLSQKGAKVDATIPLYGAIQYYSTGIVKALIDGGVDVNAKDEQGYTPLHWAIFENKKDVVKLLLKAEKIEVNEKDEQGETPLYWAILRDRKDIVELLLEAENIDVNAKDKDENTPLHRAILENKKDIVELLLKAENIDVNEKDNDENTPLHLAILKNKKDVVTLLLEAENIDVNATGKDGKTPLYLAYNIGSGDIRYQNQDIVKILLQKGAEVDATILHLVIQHSSTDIVKAIIDKGVDINETDKQGKTPLHWTIFKNKKDVVKLLLEAEKIDINAIDGQGRTPLYWAVVFYCTDATKVLIQKTLIQDFSVQKPDYLTGAFSTYWDKCKNEIEGKGSVNDGSTLKNKNDSKTIQRKSSVTNSELSGSKPTSEQKNNTQGNDKRPGSSSKNAQKNKWLTVAAPATLAIAGVVSGIAIAVYLEMLAVGIAVGACCLVAAAIIYYCNEPSNSLEDSNAEAAE